VLKSLDGHIEMTDNIPDMQKLRGNDVTVFVGIHRTLEYLFSEVKETWLAASPMIGRIR
jgi:hypothetical protein